MFFVAGREFLLKVVIQAIPSSTMSCFKLPKKLVKDIHQMIVNFLWGSNTRKSKNALEQME